MGRTCENGETNASGRDPPVARTHATNHVFFCTLIRFNSLSLPRKCLFTVSSSPLLHA